MQATYRQIREIALPIMGASLAQNAVSLIDTAFLGLLGQTELAAGGIGVLFFLTIGFIGLGLGTGVQVLSAQLLGQREAYKLGSLLRHASWVGIAIGIFLTATLAYFADPVVEVLLHDRETQRTTAYFLRGRSLELLPLMLFGVLRGFFSGTAQTIYILRANLLLALTNLLLNFVFVLGMGWGLKGVITGSVLSQYIATVYLFYALRRQRYPLAGSQASIHWLRPLLRYAGPAILQNLVGMVGWLVFFLLIESRGQFELAAANVIRSIYSFCMLPTWAFSTATGTLSGYFWGARDLTGVRSAFLRAFSINQSLNIILAAILVLTAPWIAHIFTKDFAIQRQVAGDLPMIALSIVLMPASALLIAAIVGLGMVIEAFIVEVAIIFLYVGYAFWLNRLGVNLSWMWSAEWVYWVPSAGVLYLLWNRRLKQLPVASPALSG